MTAAVSAVVESPQAPFIGSIVGIWSGREMKWVVSYLKAGVLNVGLSHQIFCS